MNTTNQMNIIPSNKKKKTLNQPDFSKLLSQMNSYEYQKPSEVTPTKPSMILPIKSLKSTSYQPS